MIRILLLILLTLPLFGWSADCEEKPLSYDELKSLASRPGITNQIDFLRAIPKDTLQTFTFVHTSQSAQGPGVSRDFPGVIRASSDGKLIIRYTCDPSKPTYNQIEVMTFDDETAKYKMASFSFKSPSTSHRTTENPKLCMQCHNPGGERAPIDPRPNWQQYETWNGFYGSKDDSFLISPEEEKQQYLKFKQEKKDDPCYSLLPWPGGKMETDLLPYSNEYKSNNQNLRPNNKLTINQCLLVAKRAFRKFKQRPEYSYVRNTIASALLDCKSSAEGRALRENDLEKVLPDLIPWNTENNLQPSGIYNPGLRDYQSAAYRVFRTLGFSNADLTMHFNSPEQKKFHCGDSGSDILAFMANELLGEVATSTSSLNGVLEPNRLTSKARACYAEKPLRTVDINKPSDIACKDLENAQNIVMQELTLAEARSNLQRLAEERKNCRESVINKDLNANFSEIQEAALMATDHGKPNAVRGKTLSQSVCAKCHNEDFTNYSFFNDEDHLRDKINSNPNFVDQVISRVSSGTMPPGEPLNELEKKDLAEYLKSFLPPR
jgi:cytochrome c553